ncbi:hypothetical protein, partial [Klebsiella pneumoniae]|uniref:hypothetical protein n=3 Tax=Klebsiella pneumoniae TaxID=573 RepID=UPI001C53A7C2
ALRMNMMISYQELVRTFPSEWALVVYNESSSINTPLLTSPEYTLQNKLKETSEWRVILDECNAMELLYQRRQLKRLSELL